MKNIVRWQEKILKILSSRAGDYCLGAGTALSKVYFNHRQSFDLDFFVLKYSRKDILSLMDYLSQQIGKDFKLTRESKGKGKVGVMIFQTDLNSQGSIKIDFIEDYIKRLKPPKNIDGICVLSLEDIYLRKVYAVAGTMQQVDEVGRSMPLGGRQEAKDFYDLYFLSYTFMNLSNFISKYCNLATQESLVHWFRSYSRMDIKSGLLELKAAKKIDYKVMENHFKAEIDKIIELRLGQI